MGDNSSLQIARTQEIASKFKKLVRVNFRQYKSPSWYAARLNLSVSYLNECVKTATGDTVSAWIQQEIVLEAKRMLAHSSESTKVIAYNLGYEDPAYFNRLFFKVTGLRPSAFRQVNRE